MSTATKTYSYPITIKKDGDGYFVRCPDIQGCHSCGDTYEEALANIAEAIQACLEDIVAKGEEIPTPATMSFSTVEVSL